MTFNPPAATFPNGKPMFDVSGRPASKQGRVVANW